MTPSAFASDSGHATVITHPTPEGISPLGQRRGEAASEPTSRREAAADAILRAAGIVTMGVA